MAGAARTRSWAFARRPAWILGHLLVIVAIVVMVNLGMWQLRRLDERKAGNALVRARTGAAAVPVETLAGKPAAAVEFRRVEATGRYDIAHEVLVGYRTSDGLPGYHVVTPLRLDDGRNVLVNRGFVPLPMAQEWPVADAEPPATAVRVIGILRRSFDAKAKRLDPAKKVPTIDEVDVPVIDPYVPGDLLPMSIELQVQDPPSEGYPARLPDLDLSNGPHLSYAIQWFSFSAIAGVGWIAALRRRATTVNPRRRHLDNPP